MNDLIDQGKYKDGLKTLGNSTFGQVRQTSHKYWMPVVNQALETGRVGAIQPNYELPLHPEYMTSLGFIKGFHSEHYSIWIQE